MIKAIDTYYNGNYFRSRLEARWAVFFDAAGIKYQYEPEGFVLDNGECYLPDFYLPEMECYCEVKPDDFSAYINESANESAIVKHKDFGKWAEFSKSKDIVLLIGNPHYKSYFRISPLQDNYWEGCNIFRTEQFEIDTCTFHYCGWVDGLSPFDKVKDEEMDHWLLMPVGKRIRNRDLIIHAETANKTRFEHDKNRI